MENRGEIMQFVFNYEELYLNTNPAFHQVYKKKLVWTLSIIYTFL